MEEVLGPEDYLYKYFNGDSIVELRKHGNPIFARGAFGEISIGIQKNKSVNGAVTLSLVAIKTILNAAQPTKNLQKKWGLQASSSDNTNCTIIEKNVTLTAKKISPDVNAELTSLLTLKPHPNIVKLVGVFQPKDDPIMMASSTALSFAFEYCPIDLFLALEWRRRRALPFLSHDIIRTISKDIVSAIGHCHEHRIIHGDIKPDNILVSDSGCIKLCDFGLSKFFLDDNNQTAANASDTIENSNEYSQAVPRGICTLNYRPPEVLLGGRADHPSVDIYGIGVVICELLIGGRILFPGTNELDQLGKIFSCLGTPSDTHWPAGKELPNAGLIFEPRLPQRISKFIPRATESTQLEAFLEGMLQLDPECRKSSVALLNDNWLQRKLTHRINLLIELVDVSIDTPWILSDLNDPQLTFAMEQAIALSSRRRSFLRSAGTWVVDER